MKKGEKDQKLWFRLVLFLIPRLVSSYFKLVDLTSRTIFLNTRYEEEICKRMPFACACFHGTMLFPVYYCRRYPGVVMVSRSHDGEIIDRSIRRLGYDTVRGSSSKGGKEALVEMIEQIKERNYCSGLAVDAPRGPSRQVKMGIVIVGRETGQPIVPFVSWSTRQIQFKSWDSMIVPLPFSTIVMTWGKPTLVAKGLSNEEYEKIRQDIETEMLDISAETEKVVQQIKEGRYPEENGKQA